MMPERLEDATHEAERQGYITNEQAEALLKELEREGTLKPAIRRMMNMR
jgi:hypothetical protein